ncbi:MAG: VCBS repeat-containing protein [Chloroflexi bacterium]|nr:VCBS repeat-containing protein [Chloroflexota bacterium]
MARARLVSSFLFTLWLVACAAPTPIPLPTPTPTRVLIPASTPSRVPATATLIAPTPTHQPLSTPLPIIVPSSTPRPRQFDDTDTRALLGALFPNMKLVPIVDAFTVNDDPDWQLWITSRVEGQFVQGTAPELAAIVAHQAPRLTPDLAQQYAPMGSFLALFQKREGKLVPTQRAFLFPTDLSPLTFEVTIERATDFDRDGQNEMLILTSATRMGITTIAAFLYQWDDPQFVELWSAEIGSDNTGAVNQAEYAIVEPTIRLADLDGDGFDEIIVEATRIEYAKDDQGLANLDREVARRTTQRVYRWDGTTFALMP